MYEAPCSTMGNCCWFKNGLTNANGLYRVAGRMCRIHLLKPWNARSLRKQVLKYMLPNYSCCMIATNMVIHHPCFTSINFFFVVICWADLLNRVLKRQELRFSA